MRRATRKPRITQAPTRRPESIIPDGPREVPTYLRENESADFPGMHTVIVPRDDPRDNMHMSPVGKYKGMGYEVLSEDPQYTNHAGHVLMGINVDTYNRREEERVQEGNAAATLGYGEVYSDLGERDKLRFVPEKSGVKARPDFAPRFHAQLEVLRQQSSEIID